MSPARRPPAGLLVVGGLVALAVVLFLPFVFTAAAGPETEILDQLKRTERLGLELPIPGETKPLHSQRHSYDRLHIRVDTEARTAEVFATLDFTGKLGGTEVRSLGFESIPFALRDRVWVPVNGLAPRLQGAVTALAARRQALASGNVEALQALREGADGGQLDEPALSAFLSLQRRDYRAHAWRLRSERDSTVVSEAFQMKGDRLDRPLDEKGDRTLSLKPVGREFRFTGGLM
jgi:hypothetical protein